MRRLPRPDWIGVACGAAAGFQFAQVLLQDRVWLRALSLVAFTGLVAVVVSRLAFRKFMSVQQQFESILEAHIPTNVALTLNDDGTASAFVKRGDGEMHAVTIPEQIAEQGPQACLSYVADLSMEELRRELEDG